MIYLITDSTACLTQREANQLQTLMVPMYYGKGGRTMDPEGFMAESTATPSPDSFSLEGYTTAQASVYAFSEVFARVVKEGNEALCITISSRLSGTYQNACRAAEDVGQGRIRVLDSLSTAGGLFLLLKEARAKIEEGASLDQVHEWIQSFRSRARTLFTLSDMEPLRKSGRLGFVRMSVSTLLNIRPILQLQDGAVVSHSMARGMTDILGKLKESVKKPQGAIVVQHSGQEEKAQALAERFRSEGHQVLIRQLNLVLLVHLGYPCLSVAWVEQE